MLNFTKMHGLGNDFVVIDGINQSVLLTPKQIKFIANRRIGVGCDQLLLVEKATTTTADFTYRIFNADGSEVGQCGNGARCLARFLRAKKLSAKDKIIVNTCSGLLSLQFDADLINVDMGVPQHSPAQIPVNTQQEALYYSLCVNNKHISFGAVAIGNPHIVIQVDDIQSAPVSELGAILESHVFFPERINVGFMQVINRQHIKLRVYERGCTETLACGSGACAAAVIGIRQQILDKGDVRVELTGGHLIINWLGLGQTVTMKGSADFVFEGQIEL